MKNIKFEIVDISNGDESTPLADVAGKTARTYLDSGEVVYGVIEMPINLENGRSFSSRRPILRLANGQWVRLDDAVEVAVA